MTLTLLWRRKKLFLSTLSLRRATTPQPGGQYDGLISIHALLAESDGYGPDYRPDFWISIHALLAESDCRTERYLQCKPNFYPRSPCGERPAERLFVIAQRAISIHALLAESDANKMGTNMQDIKFLSTLSLRRATRRVLKCDNRAIISIHALLAESDATLT